tara:strand:- start:3381 stop:3653 length:273 start_codon:yes stop_codon:yes gene_type:complete
MATNNNEKGKHPIEGFEHILTIDKLIDELNELKKDLEFEGNSLIYVAYRWKGDTVISGISSVCINGRTIQLNEEDFVGSAEWQIQQLVDD